MYPLSSENLFFAPPTPPKTHQKSTKNRCQELSMLKCMLSTLRKPLPEPPGGPLKKCFNIKIKFWASSWRPRRTQEALQILLKINKIRVWGQDAPGTPPDPQKHRKRLQNRHKKSPKSPRKSYHKYVKNAIVTPKSLCFLYAKLCIILGTVAEYARMRTGY